MSLEVKDLEITKSQLKCIPLPDHCQFCLYFQVFAADFTLDEVKEFTLSLVKSPLFEKVKKIQ